MDANFSTMTMPKTMPVQNLLRYISFKWTMWPWDDLNPTFRVFEIYYFETYVTI